VYDSTKVRCGEQTGQVKATATLVNLDLHVQAAA